MSSEESASAELAQSADGSSWLGGWFQAAKEKSMSAVNMVKKDLAEFTSTMHQDTTRIAGEVKTRVMQESASSATQKVKDGMNNLIGGISKALSTEGGPEGVAPSVRKSAPKDAVFNRSKARLRAIQVDSDTYTAEPSGDREAFAAWATDFDVEKRKEEIAELLVSNVEVRSLYTLLVPMQVKHVDFWTRYFYKVHQLQQDEARRAQLLMRVDVVAQQQHNDGDWEPDSDWGDIEGPNSPTGTEAPEILSTPAEEDTASPVSAAAAAATANKAGDRLTLSGLQCPSDGPSDSETSQAASSSDKAASSSFATVTSASSPSTQSAGLEDMECSSSDSDEPLKVEVPAHQPASSPTPAPDAAATTLATVATAAASVDNNAGSCDSRDLAEAVVPIATDTAAAEAPPSPHAKDSNGEDDWEKEFDVDSASVPAAAASTLSTGAAASNAEAEDWENWE